MNDYCVTSLLDPDFYFNVNADRFEISQSGYVYFWIDKIIVVSLRRNYIRSIEKYCKDDDGLGLNTIWTNQNGFAV